MLLDPTEEELHDQVEGFCMHRHDQSLITAIAYYDKQTLVLPECMENFGEDCIIFASRIRAKDYRAYLSLRFKYYLRRYLGGNLYNRIKNIIK